MNELTDDILRFYRGRHAVKRRRPPRFDPAHWTLTNTPQGLGDCVVLTDHFRACSRLGKPAAAYSPAPPWPDLLKFCPWAVSMDHPRQVSLCHAAAEWDLGPGHMIDKARRLFGFRRDIVSRGAIEVPWVKPKRNRIGLHFEAGFHARWQSANIHPRARQLYAANRKVIRDFITEHGDEYSWIEFGHKRTIDHELADDGTNRPLGETIPLMAECDYHIGLVSGPMHIAAALGLKVITVLNFPHPGQLMLPNLVDLGVVEQEWLYPQAVHLHQDADSKHWPIFNRDNLKRALDGEVYPFWDPKIQEAFL